MRLLVLLVALPVAILASDFYMPCPHECRCTDMISKHAPHNWRMMMSERRLHRLMFGPGRHYFSRRISESQSKGGRQMTCLGLLSMPSYIPPDIEKLCIYGDVQTAKRKPDLPADSGYLRDSPYGRDFNRVQSINDHHPRQLTNIDKTKFSSATKMKQLALEGNRIKAIHPMQFDSLGELTELSLKNNRLKSLAKEAFMSLANLQELDLTDNQIKRISSDVFSYTPKLRQLKLKNNRLQRLSPELFRNLRHLEVLDLSENKLAFLPDGIFDDLQALKELHLSTNALGEIKASLFYYLPRLTKLTLNGNQLTSLPGRVFLPLIHLRHLDLSENKLTVVSTFDFNSLINLNHLTLSHNRIKTIEDGAFKNLSALVNLNLDNNKLEMLRGGMWLGLKNLQRLRLDNNQITAIDNSLIEEMTRLQAIDLSHNKISRVPKRTFKDFLQLREVKLNNNEIKYLDDEAFGVSMLNSQSKITWIYLQYNLIRNIKPRAFYGLPWLKFVNICHNKIRSIHEKAFTYAKNINTLILNNNELATLELGTFQSLKRLKLLNLAHNDLADLSFNVFLGLELLENLNLEFNQINEMSYEAFLDTPNLRTVDFTGNRLRTVDLRHFESMIKLRHLEFTKNEITNVLLPTFFQGLLKYLSFSDNRLHTLDGNITNTLSFGGVLGLDGNPWLCDCHMTWLPKLAMQGYIGLPREDDLTCKQPENVMGRQVTGMSSREMPCLPQDHYRRLTAMMETSYMRQVCNVAPTQVPGLTAKRARLPRKELAHWHVTMRRTQNGDAVCNGVILDQSWVLTTATCWRKTTSHSNGTTTIIVGETSRKLSPWKIRAPERVVFHPNYTSIDGPNDLALVEMKPLKPFIRHLLTRFPCMLDRTLQNSVLRHRRRGRVSSRLTTKTRVKVRAKSVKVRSFSDLIYTTARKLTDSYDAEAAPLYFDLGEAGWALAGLKNSAQKSDSFSHQFIPLGPHASWIDGVLSGRHSRA